MKHEYRPEQDTHFKNDKACCVINHMTHAFHATGVETCSCSCVDDVQHIQHIPSQLDEPSLADNTFLLGLNVHLFGQNQFFILSCSDNSLCERMTSQHIIIH